MQQQLTGVQGAMADAAAAASAIRKILVPLDGSELAESVLPHVEVLAWRLDAEVLLLRAALAHVLPGISPTDPHIEAVTEAEAYLDHVLAGLRRAGIRADGIVPYGPPAEMILDQAEFHHADLIVMATHGRSGLSRWVYGSVTERVLASARRPLVVVRASAPAVKPTAPAKISRVLVALDGSEFVGDVLPPVATLAGALGAEVHLLRVVPRVDRRLHSRDRAMNEYLNHVADWLQSRGLSTRAVVRRGLPVETIVKYCQEERINLIALATNGPSGFGRWLFAGASVDVLRTSPVPVLLLQPGEAAVNLAIDPPRSVRRCHNCGRVTYLQAFGPDDCCLRCGFHLRACANCAFYDGIVCTKDYPSSRDVFAGSHCPNFVFREMERGLVVQSS